LKQHLRRAVNTSGPVAGMQNASHYREQAERARRLARVTTARAIEESLARTAKDYSDIADDLESGAIEIRHPELMPPLRPRERSAKTVGGYITHT
jgi:hypothetical protein